MHKLRTDNQKITSIMKWESCQSPIRMSEQQMRHNFCTLASNLLRVIEHIEISSNYKGNANSQNAIESNDKCITEQAYDMRNLKMLVTNTNANDGRKIAINERQNSAADLKQRINSMEKQLKNPKENNSSTKTEMQMQMQMSEMRQQIRLLKVKVGNLQHISRKKQLERIEPTETEILKMPVSVKQWVDSECKYFKYLIFSENRVTAKCDYAHIFGKRKVDKQYSFAVKIGTMQYCVGLGIVDSQYKKSLDMNMMPNRIVYWNNGVCDVASQKKGNQGGRFKSGEKVTVQFDEQLGTVQWRVGNEIRHKMQHYVLQKNSIQFVPFVILGNKNDSVQIWE